MRLVPTSEIKYNILDFLALPKTKLLVAKCTFYLFFIEIKHLSFILLLKKLLYKKNVRDLLRVYKRDIYYEKILISISDGQCKQGREPHNLYNSENILGDFRIFMYHKRRGEISQIKMLNPNLKQVRLIEL